MIALCWRQPDPLLVLRWRGPDQGMTERAVATPSSPVAVLIGPPGVPGPQGPVGPVADIIDGGTFT